MSFQKCPKCNGHGVVTNHVFDVNKPETMFGQPFHIPCPLCFGEFVIHEEQGVPPSKVRQIDSISKHIEALEALVLEITTSGKSYTKEAVKQRMQFYRQMLNISTTDTLDMEGLGPDPEKPLCSCIKDVCMGLETYTCKYPKP